MLSSDDTDSDSSLSDYISPQQQCVINSKKKSLAETLPWSFMVEIMGHPLFLGSAAARPLWTHLFTEGKLYELSRPYFWGKLKHRSTGRSSGMLSQSQINAQQDSSCVSDTVTVTDAAVIRTETLRLLDVVETGIQHFCSNCGRLEPEVTSPCAVATLENYSGA